MHHFKTLMCKLLIDFTVALLVQVVLSPPPPPPQAVSLTLVVIQVRR